MTVYVILLRAINVGGTSRLSMAELRGLCKDIGFSAVETYIQSGNLILDSDHGANETAAMLDQALAVRLGKAPGVFVRTAAELAAVVDNNPFPAVDGSRVLVHFFAEPLPDNALAGISAPDGEEAVALNREIYVHYPIGSGRSRLKLPILKQASSRNMNTVAKLAEAAKARMG